MAVEAHHLRLFPSQLLQNREIMNAAIQSQAASGNLYDHHPSSTGTFLAPPSISGAAFFPIYNNCVVPAAASDSGLTFVEKLPAVPRKRQRVCSGSGNDRAALAFLGEDVSSHLHQQQLEIDRLIAHHAEKVMAEVMERRRRMSSQILAAVEEGLSRRVREKEEEIERLGRLNWAMEERIRILCVENQIWRDLAQSNEVAANVLRTNLEQLLVAQQQAKEEEPNEAAAEDAESCCGGDVGGGDGKEEGQEGGRRMCRCCGEGEAAVLLLPCRHLCLCVGCGPAVDACPVCECGKDGSVVVNFA